MSSSHFPVWSTRALSALAALVLMPVLAHAGATITIVAGTGFSDPTAATPVGGNSGTTVGAQRLIAFQYAADLWGATLDSNVEIRVNAQFIPQTCTQTSAVLGSASPARIVRDFPSAPFATTWYPVALANRLAGTDLIGDVNDIEANFNSSINADPNCLQGATWYYGLDTNQSGNQINLVAVLLHELAHGLGFTNMGSVSDGTYPEGHPSIYGRHLFDLTQDKFWNELTVEQRQASAINSGNVVWAGSAVSTAAPNVLSGTPQLTITAPPALAGAYGVGTATFGPALTASPLSGQLLFAADGTDANSNLTTDACSTLTNAAAIGGKIAMANRGNCTFKTKAKNAQEAGAVALVVMNNTSGPPPGMGDDPTITTPITIPLASITQTDGLNIGSHLAVETPVNGFLSLNLALLAGADSQGRPKMNAPNPVQTGSSISHWDPATFPNQLMEPSINDDLTHSVKAPQDLTRALFTDIGWGAESTPPPTAPVAAFLPSPLAFGNKLLGYGTFTGWVKLSNAGNAAMTVSSVTLSGNAAFARSHDCPGSLAAGAFCTITVTYLPPGTGSHTAALSISTNASGSPHTVNISGTGVTDLLFSLSRPTRPGRAGTGSGNVFDLTITPAAGFGGLVELTCEAGAGTRCAVAPGRVRIEGAAATARVTVEPSRSLRLRRAALAETPVVRLRVVVGGRARVVELPVTISR